MDDRTAVDHWSSQVAALLERPQAAVSPSHASGGVVIGRCPRHAPEHTCWKLVNPDPSAHSDFWVMLTVQRIGDLGALVSQLVPTADGWLHLVQHPTWAHVQRTRLVEKTTTRSGSFGPVVVSRLKAKIIYEAFSDTLIGIESRFGRYDINGQLVSPYEVSHEPPPLPQGRDPSSTETTRFIPAAALSQLEAQHLQAVAQLHFIADGIEDGDGDLRNGRRVEPTLPPPVEGLARPEGIYFDILERQHPPLHLVVVSRFFADGRHRTLSADYCFKRLEASFTEQIIVRRSRSWFRSKKKIIRIRTDFFDEGLVCETLAGQPIGSPKTARRIGPSIPRLEPLLTALHDARRALHAQGKAAEPLVQETISALPRNAPALLHAFGNVLSKQATTASPVRARFVPRPPPPPDEAHQEFEDLSELTVSSPTRKARSSQVFRRPRFSKAWLAKHNQTLRAVRSLGQPLPIRDPGPPDLPWVKPLPETYRGLVHGGIVQGRGFYVIVRAFRSFEHLHLPGAKRQQVEQVAGVCEIRRDDHSLIQRFSSEFSLHTQYESAHVPLTQNAMEIKEPRLKHLQGFYIPTSMVRSATIRYKVHLRPQTLGIDYEPCDDGLPEPLHYIPVCVDLERQSRISWPSCFSAIPAQHGHDPDPGPEGSLEHALHIPSHAPMPGFVIDTPYVSVFAPGPDATSMIVSLVGVAREATVHVGRKTPRHGRIASFTRRERWVVQMVGAQGIQ
ncbi:MAG: hypothetical protein AAFV53_19495 [Myxococcota bacterium]